MPHTKTVLRELAKWKADRGEEDLAKDIRRIEESVTWEDDREPWELPALLELYADPH
jgi:hypothetical protein